MGELKIDHRVINGVSVGGIEGRLDLQGAAVWRPTRNSA